VTQCQPAANDSVDEPEAYEPHRQPRDEKADAKRRDDEYHTERDPEQPEPERPNLPAKVRLEPGAARLAALHVVQNDSDDGRPAGKEGSDHRRGAEDAGEQAEGVQPVDELCPTHERRRRRRLLHSGSLLSGSLTEKGASRRTI